MYLNSEPVRRTEIHTKVCASGQSNPSKLFAEISTGVTMVKILHRYGLLSLPVGTMLCLGLFGFRPGQVTLKPLGYVTNGYCILTYVLASTCAVGFLVNNFPIRKFTEAYVIAVVIYIEIYFTVLMFTFYRKYILKRLMDDVVKVKRNKLTKMDTAFVCLMFFAVLAALIFLLQGVVTPMIDVCKNGKNHSSYASPIVDASNRGVLCLFMILQQLIFNIHFYLGITGISLTASTMAIILRREFQACVGDLAEALKSDTTLHCDVFTSTGKRFNELTCVVHRMDGTVCPFFGLIVLKSFGELCVSIYGVIVQDDGVEVWIQTIVLSVLSLVVLLPSATALNTQVRNEKIQVNRLIVTI